MKTKHRLTPTSPKQTAAKAEVLKIGIDVHKRQYVVVAQFDNQSPKSPQKFSPESFLAWVCKQRERSQRVVTCYEAGCFGYVLHRRLAAMGIENLVVRPRNWDEYGSKVKTDARDATELCSHLDRYLAGNERALSIVRVPSEEQERCRSIYWNCSVPFRRSWLQLINSSERSLPGKNAVQTESCQSAWVRSLLRFSITSSVITAASQTAAR